MFTRKQKQTMFSEYYRQLYYFYPNIFSQKNESYFTSVDNTSYSCKFFQVFIRTFTRGSHLDRAKLLATTPTNTTFHFFKKRLVRYSLPRPKERNSQREATVNINMEVVWLPFLSPYRIKTCSSLAAVVRHNCGIQRIVQHGERAVEFGIGWRRQWYRWYSNTDESYIFCEEENATATADWAKRSSAKPSRTCWEERGSKWGQRSRLWRYMVSK